MSKQSRDFQKGYIIGQNLGKEPKKPQKPQKSSSSFGPVTWVVLAAFIIAIILSR